MKSFKLFTSLSMAAFLLFSASATYAQIPDTEQEGYIPTIESTIDISPEASLLASDTLSATYSFQDYTKSKGEFKSINNVSWSGSNKTVTIKLRQYEKFAASNGTVGHQTASVIYDLESQNGNRCGAVTITELYSSTDGTVTWTNVKPGTYRVVFKIAGTGYTDGSGTFTVS